MHRRQFILNSALAMAAASVTPLHAFLAHTAEKPKFNIAPNPGIIRVKANFAQTLDYAIQYEYEAISPSTHEVMKDYSDAQLNEITAKMQAHNITYDSINIPVEFRRDDATFKEGLKDRKSVV